MLKRKGEWRNYDGWFKLYFFSSISRVLYVLINVFHVELETLSCYIQTNMFSSEARAAFIDHKYA